MGMFDEYKPTITPTCPQCGAVLKRWQGKDGPCQLLVWRQGERGPVDQRVDDKWRLQTEELECFRLPARFLIYTDCCTPGLLAYAICTATDGVWTETRLLGPEEVDELFADELNDRHAAPRNLNTEENGKAGKLK